MERRFMEGGKRISLLFVVAVFVAAAALGCRAVTRPAAAKGEATHAGTPNGEKSAAAKLDQYWQNAQKEVDKSVLEILAQHRA